MRGEDAPLGRRYGAHLGFRPGIEILQFLDVSRRPRAIVRGVGRIVLGQRGSDVPDVDDPVLRVEPRMLVNLFGRFAPWGALFTGAVGLRAPADDDLAAAELDAFEQGFEPGFKL